MRSITILLCAAALVAPGLPVAAENQTPPSQSGAARGQGSAPATAAGGQRGRGGRGAVQVMTLTVPWTDGGQIPIAHTQAGGDTSPALSWSAAPEGTASFVLVVHDLDAVVTNSAAATPDDLLHWLVWNIPPTATGLPAGVPQGPQLSDGTRQISATGPNYRGPGAPASGRPHHYAFELFALDTTINVPPVGASPAETRAAVLAAMVGHVRGKAVAVGLWKR